MTLPAPMQALRRCVAAIVAVSALHVAGSTAQNTGRSNAGSEAAPIYGIEIPAGYRGWSLVNVAHEAGDLNDLRAVLGNPIAIRAFENGTQRFPTAQSLPGWLGNMCHQRKTMQPLADPNLS
jgi:hypothetical protein